MMGLFSLMYYSNPFLVCEWHDDLKTCQELLTPESSPMFFHQSVCRLTDDVLTPYINYTRILNHCLVGYKVL